MSTSGAQIKAVARYNSKKYASITIRVSLEKHNQIKDFIKSNDESLNGFICRAIFETMDRESSHISIRNSNSEDMTSDHVDMTKHRQKRRGKPKVIEAEPEYQNDLVVLDLSVADVGEDVSYDDMVKALQKFSPNYYFDNVPYKKILKWYEELKRFGRV